MLRDSANPGNYPAYSNGGEFQFATPVPARLPHNKSGKHTCEYTVRDNLAHPDITLQVTLAFEVNHYPGERELEYELAKAPEIDSVRFMWIRGYEFEPTHGQQKEAIDLAWECIRDGGCVADMKEKCIESVRG